MGKMLYADPDIDVDKLAYVFSAASRFMGSHTYDNHAFTKRVLGDQRFAVAYTSGTELRVDYVGDLLGWRFTINQLEDWVSNESRGAKPETIDVTSLERTMLKEAEEQKIRLRDVYAEGI